MKIIYTEMSEGKYDIIAGVHGHAAELKLLLEKLGYTDTDGYYRHPEGRRAIFLGNLIDKGKKIRKVLHIVKEMCDHKSAEVILGAAEYQALCFWEINKSKGGYLRKHSLKNILQHSKTIKQFEEHEAEWEECLQWFMNLPLFLEKPGLRIVHGCWDEKIIEAMKDELPALHLNKVYLHRSVEKEYKEHRHLRTILKGRESTLPKPYFITGSDGEKKHEVRVRWWMNPKGATFGE